MLQVSDVKKEFERYANLMNDLNVVRTKTEKGSDNEELLSARKAKEEANRRYKNALNAVCMEDKEYTEKQGVIVRSICRLFGAEHKAKYFAQWVEENGKDNVGYIVDTQQRIASLVVSLFNDYIKGREEAKEKAKKEKSKDEALTSIDEQLKALNAQYNELLKKQKELKGE